MVAKWHTCRLYYLVHHSYWSFAAELLVERARLLHTIYFGAMAICSLEIVGASESSKSMLKELTMTTAEVVERESDGKIFIKVTILNGTDL